MTSLSLSKPKKHTQKRTAGSDTFDKFEPYTEVHRVWMNSTVVFKQLVGHGSAPDHRTTGSKVKYNCECGLSNPTRSHWITECPSYSHLRPSLPCGCEIQRKLGVPLVRRQAYARDHRHSRARPRHVLRVAAGDPPREVAKLASLVLALFRAALGKNIEVVNTMGDVLRTCPRS